MSTIISRIPPLAPKEGDIVAYVPNQSETRRYVGKCRLPEPAVIVLNNMYKPLSRRNEKDSVACLLIQWRLPLSIHPYYQKSKDWLGHVWHLLTHENLTIEPWIASLAPMTVPISSLRDLWVPGGRGERLSADDMKELKMALDSWRRLFKWVVKLVDGREQYTCNPNLAVAAHSPVLPFMEKEVATSQDKEKAGSTAGQGQYCWNTVCRGLANLMHKLINPAEVQDDEESGDREHESSGVKRQKLTGTIGVRLGEEHTRTARQQETEEATAAVIAAMTQAIDFYVANSSSSRSSQAQGMTVTEAIIDVSLRMGTFEPNFETLKMYNTVLSRFFTSPIGCQIRRREMMENESIQERRANMPLSRQYRSQLSPGIQIASGPRGLETNMGSQEVVKQADAESFLEARPAMEPTQAVESDATLAANVPGSYQEAGRTIETFRILPVHWELLLMLLIALAFGFVLTVISIVNEWLPALE